MSTVSEVPHGRGRPRDPSIDGRVLQAAREIVAEGGVQAASMRAIAKRVGCGKPTLYLRWPNARAIVEDAAARLTNSAEIEALDALINQVASEAARSAEGRFLFQAAAARLIAAGRAPQERPD